MKHFRAIRMLSDINLPATKADWVSEISVGRLIFNRWHKTFNVILYRTLHELIGRSSVILLGLSFFEIIQMSIMFNLESISPETRKLFTSSTKSFLIIYHECWKKRTVIPSGPFVFSGCIINNACHTSSSVAILISRWFIWWVIVGVIFFIFFYQLQSVLSPPENHSKSDEEVVVNNS